MRALQDNPNCRELFSCPQLNDCWLSTAPMGLNVGAERKCKLRASKFYPIELTHKSASTDVQRAGMKCGLQSGPKIYW
jgi:hypothetical protein